MGVGQEVLENASGRRNNKRNFISKLIGDLVNSEISGFYKMGLEERLQILKEFANLSEQEVGTLKNFGSLGFETANRMIENVIAGHTLPLGIATNFLINGKDYLIPMVLEEPSVVAAASLSAKLARAGGGFTTSSTDPLMIGQIQLVNIKDFEKAKKEIMEKKEEIVEYANTQDPAVLVNYGGGLKDIEAREIETNRGKMLIVHLLVNCVDAMGANAVNTLAESLAPKLEEITGGKVRLRIISNYAIHRTAKAKAVWKKEELEKSVKEVEVSGEEIVERMLDAYAFAEADVFRAATHNKGIMNGVDAVTIATGNDFRAIEAGAHSFAARKGKYSSLTRYWKNKDGDLEGEIELPVALGTIGGATKTHPTAQIALKILGAKTARELGEVIAAVGLAQNFAAIRALATEGIQRGHMKLHSKNIAVMAGAKGKEIDAIAEKMAGEKKISVTRAKELLTEIREK